MNAFSYLVCVTADRSDARHPEVERRGGEARRLEEGHDEAAEAAVDVQADAVPRRKLAQRDDVVLAAVREVNCGAYDLF